MGFPVMFLNFRTAYPAERGGFDSVRRTIIELNGQPVPLSMAGGHFLAGCDGFAHGDQPAQGRSRANRLELDTWANEDIGGIRRQTRGYSSTGCRGERVHRDNGDQRRRLATSQQVDAKQILNAVSATAMWNPHLTRDAESKLTDNFETQFPVRLPEKRALSCRSASTSVTVEQCTTHPSQRIEVDFLRSFC